MRTDTACYRRADLSGKMEILHPHKSATHCKKENHMAADVTLKAFCYMYVHV